jgi:dUTP pyrophosphatase
VVRFGFRLVHPDAALPSYAHGGDAGMDVRSVEDVEIPSGGRALVHTGLVANLPEGWEIQVRPRSGLALKHGITVLNTPGTVDSGYRGEIGVILANFSQVPFSVRKGDKVAQFVVAPVSKAEVFATAEVDGTDRGEGGFGSTGAR